MLSVVNMRSKRDAQPPEECAKCENINIDDSNPADNQTAHDNTAHVCTQTSSIIGDQSDVLSNATVEGPHEAEGEGAMMQDVSGAEDVQVCTEHVFLFVWGR
ncbi:unnamed protein product [Arctia plantaginis]|uniref:Uncharacterized protein n=1 Tax=Arctia plantaginis TaxID=874455 RepID=A0A8S1APD3_ARCPL|nr:unnamed protein product [Arctia plantaginis]